MFTIFFSLRPIVCPSICMHNIRMCSECVSAVCAYPHMSTEREKATRIERAKWWKKNARGQLEILLVTIPFILFSSWSFSILTNGVCVSFFTFLLLNSIYLIFYLHFQSRSVCFFSDRVSTPCVCAHCVRIHCCCCCLLASSLTLQLPDSEQLPIVHLARAHTVCRCFSIFTRELPREWIEREGSEIGMMANGER